MENLEKCLNENAGKRIIVHAGNQSVDNTDILSGLMIDVLKPTAVIGSEEIDVLKPTAVIGSEEIDGIMHITVDPNTRV